MSEKGFFFDMTACIGCKSCQIACKDKNDLDVGSLFRKVWLFERGKFPNPRSYFISMACNHCKEPKCVDNCPTGASYRREEDGVVLIDLNKCIGCKYCTWSCPYEARHYNKDNGKVEKCNACLDLLQQGEKPACIDACIMRVLEYESVEELNKKHKETTKDIDGLPDSNITKPNIILKPHKHAYKREVR